MEPGSSFHLLLLSLLLISFLQASSVASSCPTGWTFFEKNCYGLFIQVPLNFTEAEECHSFGDSGHLASILSPREMSLLAAYVKDLYKAGKPVWIGLHSYTLKKSRGWKWTDSASISYQSWASGQPSEAKQGEECVELLERDYLKWKATSCTRKQPYLCSISSEDSR